MCRRRDVSGKVPAQSTLCGVAASVCRQSYSLRRCEHEQHRRANSFSVGQGPGYLFLEVSEANKRKCHAVLRHSTSSPDRRFGLCFLLKQGDLCPAAQDRFGPALHTSKPLRCRGLGESAAELAGSQHVLCGPEQWASVPDQPSAARASRQRHRAPGPLARGVCDGQ